MNTKGANTEPFYPFVRAYEDLGTSYKASLRGTLCDQPRRKAMASSPKSSFMALPTGGEPWGKNTRWRSIKARIPKVRKFISEMGLVLAASAFEDFLTNVLSHHSRFSDFAQKKKSPEAAGEGENEDRERLGPLFNSLQRDIRPIEYLLALYDYFVTVRNCVVHRSGRASPAVVEKSASSAQAQCIKCWPSKPGKTIPQLPLIQAGHDIPLLPRHVIFVQRNLSTDRATYQLAVVRIPRCARPRIPRCPPRPAVPEPHSDRCKEITRADHKSRNDRAMPGTAFRGIGILKEIDLWNDAGKNTASSFQKRVDPNFASLTSTLRALPGASQ